MSPEQARGLKIDARTDIWSLGVVLYEMVAGRIPFAGATSSDLIVSILDREPQPLSSHLPDVPAELQRIVSKALRKDKEERYQIIKDMLLDLKTLRQDLDFEAQRRDKAEQYQIDQDAVADPRVLRLAERSSFSLENKEARASPTTHRVGHFLGERSARSNWLFRFVQGHWFASLLIAISIVSLIAAVALSLRWRSPLPPPRIVRTVQLTNDGRHKEFYQLVTDGSRLYFWEDLGQTAGFAQVPTTGGESTLIPAPFLGGPSEGILFDISPGRNELLVGSAHAGEVPALWVMSVMGGSGRRLGDLRGLDARWSPDSQRVAYRIGRDLYIAKSDGSESRKLATPAVDGYPLFLSWSPDGTRLRFNMFDYASDTSFLWEEAVDGTGLHPLLPGWKKSQWGGRWTPDGRYYVFLVGGFPQGGYPDIWAIRETKNFFGKVDREPIQLTFGPLGFFPPVFSPDGKRLFAMGYLPHNDSLRYDLTTKHWVPVPFLSGLSASDVDFSKDGKWVTYVTLPDGRLWRSRADGSQRVQLASPEIRSRLPRWSPDGKQIAFTGLVSGQAAQVYVVSAEGGEAEQLVHRNCNDFDPTWSPDGNRLAFAPITETSCKAAIYLLDLKSRQVSTIIGSDGLFSPRWSPDGNSIVAITADSARLMLFSFATQRWEEAVKGSVGYPVWSHDGRFVYFMGDNNDVLRVRIADHKVEKAASLTGVHLQWNTGISLTPDDVPLVLNETSVYELYALDWEAP
jgi:Tol biopolymer transport system component